MLPTLFTGASKYVKQCSEIKAAISDAIPPNKVSSCKIKALPVFLTELYMVPVSNGCRVLKSIMSAEILCSLFSFRAQCTPAPYVIMVISFPSFNKDAFPISIV